MARWLAALAAAAALMSQEAAQQPKEQAPPEEDESIAPAKEYTFNPLQADKEMYVGRFYMRKGSFRAAATRFEEAAKWNPGLPDAWLMLGEAQEKMKDKKAARAAYEKFLEAAPDDKRAADVRKRLTRL